MPIALSKIQSQLLGAITAGIFGLGLIVAGGRLIIYDYMLTEPVKVFGFVTSPGRSLISRSGNTTFVRYQLVDQFGKT